MSNVEAVVNRRRCNPSVGHLAPRDLVDGDMAPPGIAGRQLGDVGKALALPGRIVMMQYRRAAA